MKTIIGESWQMEMTDEEYDEWWKYDDAHPHLKSIPMEAILRMFISHYRRGENLNIPIATANNPHSSSHA